MNNSLDDVRENFQDLEYREAYADDYLNTYVATQIQVLREQRGLSQEQLADLIGSKQPGVSRLENVNHSSWKTDTLKKIAKALDVRLKISFETYGDLYFEIDAFGRGFLQRPTFDRDPVFFNSSAFSAAAGTTNNSADESASMAQHTTLVTLTSEAQLKSKIDVVEAESQRALAA
jgi:transcriptional regulator with XRE-family HTH domain